MEKRIVVLNADWKQCQELCAHLEESLYRATSLCSLTDREKHFQGGGILASTL